MAGIIELFIFLILLSVAVYLLTRRARTLNIKGRAHTVRALPIRLGGGLVFLLALLLGFHIFSFGVDSKQYGVLKTFGKTSDHGYGSGRHLKWPWQNDVSVDGKVHIDGYTTDKDDSYSATYPCIQTQIGNGAPSCVNVTVRWQVDQDQAPVLYQNYGTDDPTDQFGASVIHAQILQVVPIVVGDYNPLTQLKVVKSGAVSASGAASASFRPEYDALSTRAQGLLQERVTIDGHPEATIQSVAISGVPLDSGTAAKISQFNQEVAKTRIEQQSVQTNIQTAKANKKIERSLEQSPGILVQHCLDVWSEAITDKYQMPPGALQCSGSGSSVVIPATR